MKTYELKRQQWIPRPLPEVFEFFSAAENLEDITPAFLNFRILNPRPIKIEAGKRIEYHLSVHGVPVRWTTEIAEWDPPRRFIDIQLKWSYRHWHHTHQFEAEGNGTRMTDLVRYALLLGLLGRLTHRLWVRRDVERIFDYRAERIRELLFGTEHLSDREK